MTEVQIDYLIKFISAILTLVIGALIKRSSEKQSRLTSYYGHISNFIIKSQNENPDFSVYTHSIIIRNAGKKTANNVRIGHHYLPLNINFLPPIRHRIERHENPPEIIIDSLVPKEEVTISYLYTAPLQVDQIHSYIKSDDGFAKEIKVIQTMQYPRSVLAIISILIIAGGSLVMYWLIRLIRYIIL